MHKGLDLCTVLCCYVKDHFNLACYYSIGTRNDLDDFASINSLPCILLLINIASIVKS